MITENLWVIKIEIGFRNEKRQSGEVAGYGIVFYTNLLGEPRLIIADRAELRPAERYDAQAARGGGLMNDIDA